MGAKISKFPKSMGAKISKFPKSMGAKEGFSKIDGCNCIHCTPLAAALKVDSA